MGSFSLSSFQMILTIVSSLILILGIKVIVDFPLSIGSEVLLFYHYVVTPERVCKLLLQDN